MIDATDLQSHSAENPVEGISFLHYLKENSVSILFSSLAAEALLPFISLDIYNISPDNSQSHEKLSFQLTKL